jgi:predicted RNA-binding protein with PIN domain
VESVAVVLVDARNVLRSRWPNIPGEELVDRCCAWAAENGRRAMVVFDGRAPGGFVGERELGTHCVVVGTGEESADDWIVRASREHRRYWLVTSDRALRDAAGGRAEKVVGGGAFAAQLLAAKSANHGFRQA